MNQINVFISKGRTLAKAAVTWLIAAQVGFQWLLTQEIVMEYPDAVHWIGRGTLWVAAAILIVRRVTPAEEHGL